MRFDRPHRRGFGSMGTRVRGGSGGASRRGATALAKVLATVLTAAALLAGCSDGDGDEPEPAPSASTAIPADAEVVTEVSFGEVAGRLPRAERDRLAADVRTVVDGWFDAAYLDGTYPRADFAGAWPGFTQGAAARAKRDADLMSNRDIGAEIDGVEPVDRAVRIDVLAADRKPVGVTAHVRLRFDTVGDPAKRVRVAGRLFLTERKQGWRVFGYDVTKGVRR